MFKRKKIIETEILNHLHQPYLIYSKKGKLLRKHPRASQILIDLGLNENVIQEKENLLLTLHDQELSEYDSVTKKILHDHLVLETAVSFSGIIEFESTYIFVQLRDLEMGCYVIFKDVTSEYKLNQGDNKLALSNDLLISLLDNLPSGILICDAHSHNATTLHANSNFLKYIDKSYHDLKEASAIDIISEAFDHKQLNHYIFELICGYKNFSIDIVKREDDPFKKYSLSGKLLLNDDNLPHLFLFSLDEQKSMRKKRRKSQNLQSDMEQKSLSSIAGNIS